MATSHNIIFDLYERSIEHPNIIALVYKNNAITYRELYILSIRSKSYFLSIGVRPQDVVALSFKNELLYALSILGLAALGATSLCISISTTPIQRKIYSQQARCNRYFTDIGAIVEIDPIWKILNLENITSPTNLKYSWLNDTTGPLMLAIGSGSTGIKKLMAISHKVMRERCKMVSDDPILQSGSRILCMSSLSFISVGNRLFNSISSGTTFVLLDDGIEDFFSFVERNKVTALVLSVFHLEKILKFNQIKKSSYFSNKIKAIRCVGSLLSEDLKRRVYTSLNQNIINSYASNESGVITRTRLPAKFDNLPNIGFPLRGVKVEIVDASNRILNVGARGFIRISSPGLIDGYLYDPSSTFKVFQDGWFYPKDIGELTGDGSLLYHGRSDRMMIFNGINIFPVEIEQTLSSHECVADCIAFPLKDKVSQDIPVCAVSLRSGFLIEEKKLLQYSVERLGYSSPKRIFILEKLPKTVEGKVILSEVLEIIKYNLQIK